MHCCGAGRWTSLASNALLRPPAIARRSRASHCCVHRGALSVGLLPARALRIRLHEHGHRPLATTSTLPVNDGRVASRAMGGGRHRHARRAGGPSPACAADHGRAATRRRLPNASADIAQPAFGVPLSARSRTRTGAAANRARSAWSARVRVPSRAHGRNPILARRPPPRRGEPAGCRSARRGALARPTLEASGPPRGRGRAARARPRRRPAPRR
jgi:hypothetical protein